mmetsp:Transcript_122024/g.350596  ORF Transcript_122024/g.350596 Transcript_122024/m.350596 type:complete len:209 (+) Transcript_122024:74-700(+)
MASNFKGAHLPPARTSKRDWETRSSNRSGCWLKSAALSQASPPAGRKHIGILRSKRRGTGRKADKAESNCPTVTPVRTEDSDNSHSHGPKACSKGKYRNRRPHWDAEAHWMSALSGAKPPKAPQPQFPVATMGKCAKPSASTGAKAAADLFSSRSMLSVDICPDKLVSNPRKSSASIARTADCTVPSGHLADSSTKSPPNLSLNMYPV